MRRVPILLACLGTFPFFPLVAADDDPPPVIPCDRSPTAVVVAILSYPEWFLELLLTRTQDVAGKLKCTAYEMAFLCSDETFPPIVSPFRTNPTNEHGHFSPCFEVFTPGFEHLAGCPTAHALRHRFTPSTDAHACVPLDDIVLPSSSLSIRTED